MSIQIEFILNYLKGKDYISPTEIGREFGKKVGKEYHSSWASPKCKKLVEEGLLVRNDKGHYKIKGSKLVTMV